MEPFFANYNYGHAEILRRYSGFSAPINAIIAHGVTFDPEFIHESELKAPLPVLSWPPIRDAAYHNAGKVVIPSAAPFLYALKLAKPSAEPRRGTLFLPAHSTALHPIDIDWQALADSLKELPQPVTVCLFYNDLDKAHYFADYRITSAGSWSDKEHLFKQIALYQSVEWVCMNALGSSAFYALATGAKFRLFGVPPHHLNPSPANTACQQIYREVVEQLRDYRLENHAFALEWLGAERLLTPQELKIQLQNLQRL